MNGFPGTQLEPVVAFPWADWDLPPNGSMSKFNRQPLLRKQIALYHILYLLYSKVLSLLLGDMKGSKFKKKKKGIPHTQ